MSDAIERAEEIINGKYRSERARDREFKWLDKVLDDGETTDAEKIKLIGDRYWSVQNKLPAENKAMSPGDMPNAMSEENPKAHVQSLQESAEQGDAAAQCNLGLCYYNGNGVAKDLTEAVKWFRKAAEQGYAVAQYNLGECYRVGDGVPKDMTEAVNWYRKAAEMGFANAQRNLGMCYNNGDGIPK